ncbi:alpha/beta hydrolase [Nocardia asteroides]|uniref:alpha/beta hydrolase n=1 Tax=Nocardia asteroides TaxID=1824 RepID=UPI001E292EC8|nr:alpha/beta hydrolase family protein [Nocardia asteroides]UGT60987.1 esterase family protein [Nocardia asteroides]
MRGRVVAAIALVLIAAAGAGPTASAEPAAVAASATAPNGSRIERVEPVDARTMVLHIHSAAMGKTVPVEVQRPADTSVPRPVLYLLNGGGGGEDGVATWAGKTDALGFLADKEVNVVTAVGGRWSYYADWERPDPVLGVNRWQTFFTEELPPIIDAALGTSGSNAIAGISMAGTSVLLLAITKPGLYRSVGAYSGCAQTSDPVGHRLVRMSVETWGGGNVENLWGPPEAPGWAANDPLVHAEKLRGTTLYISSGSGLPGRYDRLGDPFMMGDPNNPEQLANQIVIGGVIEAGTAYCTRNLANRLAELDIPATVEIAPEGTHSWGYWQDDLKRSWPALAAGLS